MDKIAYISLFLIFFSVITIILAIVEVHTYPGKVAERRGHPQKDAIEATSLMGLIIFPFWMIALIWSYSNAVIGKLYDPPANKTADEDETAPDSAPDSGEH
jgi:uncharacterized membrane protein